MRYSERERAATLILLVSTDPTGRDLICRYLLRAGYTVSAAADEAAALRLLQDHSYDLLLLDGGAFGGSGRQALKDLRVERFGVEPPAVLALVDDGDRMKSGYDGECPHGILSKPVRMDALTAEVESELAHRRARRAAGHPPVGAIRTDASEQAGPSLHGASAEAGTVLMDALEAFEEGVVLWDCEDRLVICNDRYRKLFGDHGGMVVPGAKYVDLIRLQLDSGVLRIAAERRDDWLAQRVSAHRNPGEAIDHEHSDGTWVRTREYRTGKGYTIGVCTEISQMKRRETALKMSADSNRRLAAAVDAAGSAILITDPDRPGNPTVFANPAFTAMTGWPVEEALGRDRSFLNGWDTDIDELARFEEDMRAGRPTSAELQLRTRSGRPLRVAINASPIRGNEGRVTNWVIVQSDITARKETARQAADFATKQATARSVQQHADDLADLLTLLQDHLESALKSGQLTDDEAGSLLDSVLEDARAKQRAASIEHAASGHSHTPATNIEPQSALLGFK